MAVLVPQTQMPLYPRTVAIDTSNVDLSHRSRNIRQSLCFERPCVGRQVCITGLVRRPPRWDTVAPTAGPRRDTLHRVSCDCDLPLVVQHCSAAGRLAPGARLALRTLIMRGRDGRERSERGGGRGDAARMQLEPIGVGRSSLAGGARLAVVPGEADIFMCMRVTVHVCVCVWLHFSAVFRQPSWRHVKDQSGTAGSRATDSSTAWDKLEVCPSLSQAVRLSVAPLGTDEGIPKG